MGLLDGLAGQVVGKVLGAGADGAGGASGMLGLAQALISESGGLSGLLGGLLK